MPVRSSVSVSKTYRLQTRSIRENGGHVGHDRYRETGQVSSTLGGEIRAFAVEKWSSLLSCSGFTSRVQYSVSLECSLCSYHGVFLCPIFLAYISNISLIYTDGSELILRASASRVC